MNGFYVTGGRQRPGAKGHIEWFSYECATIVGVSADGSEVRPAAEYVTPDHLRPEDTKSNIVFKAGSRFGDRLAVCTQTEILIYDLPGFELVSHISHPWLNDVHHVLPTPDGTFLVANTGLDQVLELDDAGTVVREWNAWGEQDTWDRFDRDTDYRRVLTTKPHQTHPNYVFRYGDGIWVTRFHQSDIVCLTDPGKRVELDVVRIHDGNVMGNRAWFTAVDGQVAVVDLDRLEVVRSYDLNDWNDTDKLLGWCRGLHVLSEDRIIVGFSRLRPSKFKENLHWLKFKMGKREDMGCLPTRIACYDLAAGRIEWTTDLEPHGLNAVFSIVESL